MSKERGSFRKPKLLGASRRYNFKDSRAMADFIEKEVHKDSSAYEAQAFIDLYQALGSAISHRELLPVKDPIYMEALAKALLGELEKALEGESYSETAKELIRKALENK